MPCTLTPSATLTPSETLEPCITLKCTLTPSSSLVPSALVPCTGIPSPVASETQRNSPYATGMTISRTSSSLKLIRPREAT